jgi:hypothetical protein
VGGGCRHSGRAIEDCYAIYNWLPKAAVFAGWRDMDAYMRENNIPIVQSASAAADAMATTKKAGAGEPVPAEKAAAREAAPARK